MGVGDAVNVALAPPATPQAAGTLIGPFVVTTNQPTVMVSVDPALTITDVDGDAIDTDAVTNGQELYLDLRGSDASGSATLKATASGAGGSGLIVAVPTTEGQTPTTNDHAQTIVLVAASNATTSDEGSVVWEAAPTTLGPVTVRTEPTPIPALCRARGCRSV